MSRAQRLDVGGLEGAVVDTAFDSIAGLTSAVREAGAIVMLGSFIRPGGGMSGRSVSTEASGAVPLRCGVSAGGVPSETVVFINWLAPPPGQPKLRGAP